MTVYVERREGVVVGVYLAPQPGIAEEALADDDAEVVAFRDPTPPPVITATEFLDRIGSDGPALLDSPFGFALIRLAAAGSIQLDDPAVVAGMQAAVQANAISSERADELLAAPA
jgi:hypothetical protein